VFLEGNEDEELEEVQESKMADRVISIELSSRYERNWRWMIE
jgi:hypothetical protein